MFYRSSCIKLYRFPTAQTLTSRNVASTCTLAIQNRIGSANRNNTWGSRPSPVAGILLPTRAVSPPTSCHPPYLGPDTPTLGTAHPGPVRGAPNSALGEPRAWARGGVSRFCYGKLQMPTMCTLLPYPISTVSLRCSHTLPHATQSFHDKNSYTISVPNITNICIKCTYLG